MYSTRSSRFHSYFNVARNLQCTALLVGRARDRSPVVSLMTFSEATDGTMCPGIYSASKNEYQENSEGVKKAVA